LFGFISSLPQITWENKGFVAAHVVAVCRQANKIMKEGYKGATDLDTKPTDPGL